MKSRTTAGGGVLRPSPAQRPAPSIRRVHQIRDGSGVAGIQQTFEQVVPEDLERQWDLHDGQLREKPPMTFGHNRVTILLAA